MQPHSSGCSQADPRYAALHFWWNFWLQDLQAWSAFLDRWDFRRIRQPEPKQHFNSTFASTACRQNEVGKKINKIANLCLHTSDTTWSPLCHRHKCGGVHHGRCDTPPTKRLETCKLKNRDLSVVSIDEIKKLKHWALSISYKKQEVRNQKDNINLSKTKSI